MTLYSHPVMARHIIGAALCCMLLFCHTAVAQHPAPPVMDPDSLPMTNFTCREKVIGGYYADVYTGCQMFHVCTLDEKGEIHDYKFRCLLGTVFDQETRVCERSEDVDCTKSEAFFHLNNELYGPGIIPSTADTSDTSSAATVKVLDPIEALMGMPDSPPVLSDTSEAPPQPSLDSTTTPSSSPSVPQPEALPQSQSPPEVLPQISQHSQSQSEPPSVSSLQPQPIPTSSPPPPVIPPGVTASSTRMSTSTSSSVTAAYSIPPLPFTVSRTSTSVSASSRVHIQTPLVQISLHQGVDSPALPAPHLRPSLLRLAAQAQNSGQSQQFLSSLKATSPAPVTSQTPADFQDVPRLLNQAVTTASYVDDADTSSHRQKRQLTTTPGQQSFTRTRPSSSSVTQHDDTFPTENVTTSPLTPRNRTPSGITNQRRTSRGRTRFRAPNQQTNQQTGTTGHRSQQGSSNINRNTVNQANSRQVSQVAQRQQTIRTRQRIEPSAFRQIIESENQNTPLTEEVRVSPRVRQNTPKPQRIQVTRRRPFAQSPVPQTSVPQVSTQRSFLQTSTPQSFIQEPLIEDIPLHTFQSDIGLDRPIDQDTPTPITPTVLTAEFPLDSHIRVSDRVDHVTSLPDIVPTGPPTTTQPPFVFPETSFSCHDKIPGGLYGDVETGCTVFHICSVEPDSTTKDNKFVCGVGTLFDQKTRTCQVASAVDCASSASFYYLNDPLRGPVHVELAAQLPEQQFDFPRISPSSPSDFSLRSKRHSDDGIDLCRTRPIGAPLADLTSGCRDYTVCKGTADGRITERRITCKKGLLFSQSKHRCVAEKKVSCAKETLGEILGMGAKVERTANRKRRATSLLLAHRFRRAALQPLANLLLTPSVEDARARRVLYNLAALQQWVQENARHTTFIDVYTLNTWNKNGHFPKKSYNEEAIEVQPETLHRYAYISRRKRNIGNETEAEHTESEDQTAQETSQNNTSEPIISTSTVATKPDHPSLSTFTVTTTPTKLYVTVPVTTTVTPTVVDTVVVTVTTTATIVPASLASLLSTPTSSVSIQSTSLASAVEPSIQSTTPTPSEMIESTSTSGLELSGATPVIQMEISTQNAPSNVAQSQESTSQNPPSQNSSPATPSEEVISPNTTSQVALSQDIPSQDTPSQNNPSQDASSQDTPSQDTPSQDTPSQDTPSQDTPSQGTPSQDTSSQSTNATLIVDQEATDNSTSGIQSLEEATKTELDSVGDAADNSTSTAPTTPATSITANANTTEVTITNNATESAQSTVSATTESVSDFLLPEGSINVTTTVIPGNMDPSAGNNTMSTEAPPKVGPITRDNLPETNFTCKDKKLEQFYPDPEANCQVFHYCSPGFEEQQVLDLKFLCTGATMFDINTQKCEAMENVTCQMETNVTTIADPPTAEPTPSTPIADTTPSTTTADTTPSTTTADTTPSTTTADTTPSKPIADTTPSTTIADTTPSTTIAETTSSTAPTTISNTTTASTNTSEEVSPVEETRVTIQNVTSTFNETTEKAREEPIHFQETTTVPTEELQNSTELGPISEQKDFTIPETPAATEVPEDVQVEEVEAVVEASNKNATSSETVIQPESIPSQTEAILPAIDEHTTLAQSENITETSVSPTEIPTTTPSVVLEGANSSQVEPAL